jgi:hypothetical protein
VIATATGPRSLPATDDRHRFAWRDLFVVVACGLALRLIFAALTADTYDPDEFVVLTLSREFAHGALPYQQFAFFHPPGMLTFFSVLQPIISLWWPLARIAIILVDCVTVALVWRIGGLLYGRREGLAAGLVYAASPIALLAGVRVGQDPIITALGMAGLLVLLSHRSAVAAPLAGICLGLAIWFKYPALLFLPVYVLAAPRRALLVALTALLTLCLLFAPFVPVLPQLIRDSFGWQMFHRDQLDLWHRLAAVFSFWFLLNPLAVAGLRRPRQPLWLLAGFAAGACFLFTSEVYYHYFVPVVPFAALLAARPLLAAFHRAPRLLPLGSLIFLALWSAALNVQPTRAGLSALQLSAANETVRVLDRLTGRRAGVLTDQFEYSYLAHRPSAIDYFWDMRSVTDARTLERRLGTTGAVVGTDGGDVSYPPGFVRYLDARGFERIRTGSATIWLLHRNRPTVAVAR